MRIRFGVFILIICFLVLGCSCNRRDDSVSSDVSVSVASVSADTSVSSDQSVSQSLSVSSDVSDSVGDLAPVPDETKIYDANYFLEALGSSFAFSGFLYGNRYTVIFSEGVLIAECCLADDSGTIMYLRDNDASVYMDISRNGVRNVYRSSVYAMMSAPCNDASIADISEDLELFLNIGLAYHQYRSVHQEDNREVDGRQYMVFSSEVMEYGESDGRLTYWYMDENDACAYLEVPLYDLYGNDAYILLTRDDSLVSNVSGLRSSYDGSGEGVMAYKMYAQRDLPVRFAATSFENVGECWDILDNFGTDNVYLQTFRDGGVVQTEGVPQDAIDEFYKYYDKEPEYVKDLLFQEGVKIYLDEDNSFAKGGSAIGQYTTDYYGSKVIHYDTSKERYLSISVNHEIGHFMDEMICQDVYDQSDTMIDSHLMASHTQQFSDIYAEEYGNCGWHLSQQDPAEFFAEVYRYIIDGKESSLSQAPLATAYVKECLEIMERKIGDTI